MTKFLFYGSRYISFGGKPLDVGAVVPGGTTPVGGTGTTAISIRPWVFGAGSRFSIQTNAVSNDTAANVPILIDCTGNVPAQLEARIVDASGAQVVPWITVPAGPSAGPGVFLGYLNNVPAGIGYRREVRLGSTLTTSDAVGKPFNIGCMLLLWGQSNMVGTLSAGTAAGSTVNESTTFASSGVSTFFGPNGFVGSSNNTDIGSFKTHYSGALTVLRLVGKLLEAKAGRKVGVAMNPWARNSTDISGFITPAPGNVISMLSNTGTAGPGIGFATSILNPQNACGDYRIVAWHQGESPATGETTRSARFQNLKRFCEAHIAHVAQFGRPANKLTFLFALMGVGGPVTMEYLRGAVLDLVAYGATQGWDIRIGWNCIDLDPRTASTTDVLHFGGEDKRRSCYRMLQSMLNVLDPVAVPINAAGPAITGVASRAGNVVVLNVNNPGSTVLARRVADAAVTGWYANTARDFSGTDVTVTDVTPLSGAQIQVTFANAPSVFYLKHCGHQVTVSSLSNFPDVSNLIYNDFPYPTNAAAVEQFIGLPLQPTPDAIKVG